MIGENGKIDGILGKTGWKMLLIAFVVTASAMMGASTFAPSNTGVTVDTEGNNLGRVITTQGYAEITCKPDQLMVWLRIEVRDTSAEVARNNLASINNKVMKAIENLGVDKIETISYSINPQYDWEHGIRVFKGYLASTTVKVITKDLTKAGKIIDVSVKNGALVDRVNFGLSNERLKEYKAQVMADAAVDARHKARVVLSALGKKLGDLVSISFGYDYNPYTLKGRDILNDYSTAAETNLQPSDVKVSATSTVVYEII